VAVLLPNSAIMPPKKISATMPSRTKRKKIDQRRARRFSFTTSSTSFSSTCRSHAPG
jgi:hypothetical protein